VPARLATPVLRKLAETADEVVVVLRPPPDAGRTADRAPQLPLGARSRDDRSALGRAGGRSRQRDVCPGPRGTGSGNSAAVLGRDPADVGGPLALRPSRTQQPPGGPGGRRLRNGCPRTLRLSGRDARTGAVRRPVACPLPLRGVPDAGLHPVRRLLRSRSPDLAPGRRATAGRATVVALGRDRAQRKLETPEKAAKLQDVADAAAGLVAGLERTLAMRRWTSFREHTELIPAFPVTGGGAVLDRGTRSDPHARGGRDGGPVVTHLRVRWRHDAPGDAGPRAGGDRGPTGIHARADHRGDLRNGLASRRNRRPRGGVHRGLRGTIRLPAGCQPGGVDRRCGASKESRRPEEPERSRIASSFSDRTVVARCSR
jgi:hypothetical protein